MFEDRASWSFRRVDTAGKVVHSAKLISEPNAFVSAALLPDDKGVLLAGQDGNKGNVWNLSLDGAVRWKKSYEHKDKGANKKGAQQSNIAFGLPHKKWALVSGSWS
jgi:hypothetical protein